MRDLFLDFETYYDKAFSLRKMTTVEYIKDQRFATHGFSAAFGDDEVRWYEGVEADAFLASVDWADTNLVCHNTAFDGAILSFIYGYTPHLYSDTMSMANYFWEGRANLDVVARRLGFGAKTDGLADTLGLKVGTLPPHIKTKFVEYANNDVILTRRIYQALIKYLPYREQRMIDVTIRMYTQPSLLVNADEMEAYAEGLADALFEQREHTIAALVAENQTVGEKTFSSNKQFAALLEALGVEVPTKLRKPTKNEVEKKGYDKDTMVEVLALGKGDENFLALLDHEDAIVRTVVEQRIAEKSRINETRAKRFATISRLMGGKLPVPLRYMGAHTGRWSGRDSINLQNLPSRGKDKTLRKALLAPPGYRLVVADLSQIEPRVLAWLAGEYELLEAFAAGKDIYTTMHNKVFSSDYDTMYNGYKDNDHYWVTQRNIAKAMVLGLGYGMGHTKFRVFLKNAAKQSFTEDEAKELVTAYRRGVSGITALWKAGSDMVEVMSNYGYWESHRMVINKTQLVMPSNNWMDYPGLKQYRIRDYKTGKVKTEYRWGQYGENYIYGALVIENIVQALSRDIMADMAARIYDEVLEPDERIANLVHDEVVCVIREDRVERAKELVREIMSTAPSYCPGLPVNCSIDDAMSYGDAK